MHLGALAQCPYTVGTLWSRRDSPPPCPTRRCSRRTACLPGARISRSPGVEIPGSPPRAWVRWRNVPTPPVPFRAAVIPLHPIHRGDAVAVPLVTPETESFSPPARCTRLPPSHLGAQARCPCTPRTLWSRRDSPPPCPPRRAVAAPLITPEPESVSPRAREQQPPPLALDRAEATPLHPRHVSDEWMEAWVGGQSLSLAHNKSVRARVARARVAREERSRVLTRSGNAPAQREASGCASRATSLATGDDRKDGCCVGSLGICFGARLRLLL